MGIRKKTERKRPSRQTRPVKLNPADLPPPDSPPHPSPELTLVQKRPNHFRTALFYLSLPILTLLFFIPIFILRVFRISQRFGGWWGRYYVGSFLVICGIKVRARGLENLQRRQNYIFVSNHLSHFDVHAIIWKLPPHLRLLGKPDLFSIPFFGWALSFIGHVQVNRSAPLQALQSLSRARQLLERGFSLQFFAEGTRSPDGKIYPFHEGAVRLARRAGIPLVPIGISGSREVLPKGILIPRPGEITLSFGKPILPSEFEPNAKEMTEKIRQQVSELSGLEMAGRDSKPVPRS